MAARSGSRRSDRGGDPASRGADASYARPVEGLPFLDGARRFDRGERDSFITIPMAHVGLRMVIAFGVHRIEERLRFPTDRLADRIVGLPLRLPPGRARAPHIIGLHFATLLPKGSWIVWLPIGYSSASAAARRESARMSTMTKPTSTVAPTG
jgi:hypothetical protein